MAEWLPWPQSISSFGSIGTVLEPLPVFFASSLATVSFSIKISFIELPVYRPNLIFTHPSSIPDKAYLLPMAIVTCDMLWHGAGCANAHCTLWN